MNSSRNPRPSTEERFWAKVSVRGATDCWPWTGYVGPNGYGGFWNGRSPVSAHRHSFEIANGHAAAGDVDHTCHNGSGCTGGRECPHRACCNPAHLQDVTHQENLLRGETGKTKARLTHCRKGHGFTDDNTFTTRSGDRLCRTCKRAYEKSRRQEIRSKA